MRGSVCLTFLEVHSCQPSLLVPCRKCCVSKRRVCLWDNAENPQKKDWRGSHHHNNSDDDDDDEEEEEEEEEDEDDDDDDDDDDDRNRNWSQNS